MHPVGDQGHYWQADTGGQRGRMAVQADRYWPEGGKRGRDRPSLPATCGDGIGVSQGCDGDRDQSEAKNARAPDLPVPGFQEQCRDRRSEVRDACDGLPNTGSGTRCCLHDRARQCCKRTSGESRNRDATQPTEGSRNLARRDSGCVPQPTLSACPCWPEDQRPECDCTGHQTG